MPVAYTLNGRLNTVFARAWGTLTHSDLLECQRQITEHARFAPDMNQMFDFQDVEAVNVTSDGIRHLANRNPFGAGAKRAFVVSPGAMAVFGMMRMFATLTDEQPDELRVQFDDEARARSWLGLPNE